MKPRKVVIMIEAKSDAPLNVIKRWAKLNHEIDDSESVVIYDLEVHQASVQVVKEAK